MVVDILICMVFAQFNPLPATPMTSHLVFLLPSLNGSHSRVTRSEILGPSSQDLPLFKLYIFWGISYPHCLSATVSFVRAKVMVSHQCILSP